MKKLIHFMKLAWSVSPAYILLLAADSMLSASKVLLNTILPMLLIDELLGEQLVSRLVLYGGLIVLNNVGMTLLSNTLNRFRAVRGEKASQGMLKKMSEKIMNLEYSYLEDPYYLDLKERAVFSVQNQNSIANLILMAADVFSGALTLIGLAAILVTLGPVLILVLLAGIGVMLLIYRSVSRYQTQVTQELIPINRRFGYYMGLGMEKDAQKDIRLYGMEPLITKRTVDYSNEVNDMFEVVMTRMGKATGEMTAVSEGISAFSYAYVGIRTVSNVFGPLLSLGQLSMYVSAAVSFSSIVGKFGQNVVNMLQFLSWLDPYMEFMELPEENKTSGKIPFEEPVETVEFQEVSFRYPRAEKEVLSQVSFAIRRGEKISVVGLNGAGKSTLVKLLCRMYQPQSGRILVNGRDIQEYDYASYMKTISAVFQDYKLFNYTVEENITCQKTDAEGEKLAHLIREVGLLEKMQELPEGIQSRLGREYDEKGVELSGGQNQKIAIARALYKRASMVILDEPASALDPLAEAEIYEKFNSLVEEKTAIYISHRMSSSKFCDRILILDGGTVADFDTHENLMKKADSLYYKLFQAQAENYQLGA